MIRSSSSIRKNNEEAMAANKDNMECSLARDYIISELDKAGYYRVRISSLTEFDKIVGGLCWAILAIGFSTDIDLFFEEDATIGNFIFRKNTVAVDGAISGKRIRLSENIVKALRKMRCPYALQAHQIHGGDYLSLKPIILWLIKGVQTSRDIRKALIGNFALLQYKKTCSSYLIYEDFEPSKRAQKFFKSLSKRYSVERTLQLNRTYLDSHMDDEEVLIRSCLLEYGDKMDQYTFEFYSGTDDAIMGGYEEQYAMAEITAMEEAEKDTLRIREMRSNLLRNVEKELKHDLYTIDHSRIREAVKRGEEEIRSARENHKSASSAYLKKVDSELDRSLLTELGIQIENKRQEQTIKLAVDTIKTKIRRLQDAEATEKKKLRSREKNIASLRQSYNDFEKKLKLLTFIDHSSRNEKHITELRALIRERNNLKSRIKDFKKDCQSKSNLLKEELELASEQLKQKNSVPSPREFEIRKQYEAYQYALRKRTQEVARLSRNIDEIPTRLELLQYEKRFVELYEHVAAKLDETKRHVTTYNHLKEEYELMKKEESLLSSINESFLVAINSPKSKSEFLRKLEDIVQGLRSNLIKSEARRIKAFEEKKNALQKYQDLVEQQRQYFTAVAELQRECEIREELVNNAKGS